MGRNQNISASIVTGLQAGQLGFNSWQGQEFFLLCHHVQTNFRAHPASSPVGVQGSFPGVKQVGCDADHSTLSSSEV